MDSLFRAIVRELRKAAGIFSFPNLLFEPGVRDHGLHDTCAAHEEMVRFGCAKLKGFLRPLLGLVQVAQIEVNLSEVYGDVPSSVMISSARIDRISLSQICLRSAK